LRTSLKCQIHAVLAGAGVQVVMSDLFGLAGQELLERVSLPAAMRARVNSCRHLIELLDFEITHFAKLADNRLRADPGYAAVQQIPGVGPTLGAVFVAEIGDVHRFARAEQLTSWAGLTPRHRESDKTLHRGRITKQGSKLVRWAAIEAVQRGGADNPIGAYRERVAERRGRNQAKVAAARVLCECVYYALRDHHVRRLQAPPAPDTPARVA
jgi:transposase